MFSSAFVCLSVYALVYRITQKLLDRFSKNSGGKVAHGPRNELLDFGGNSDRYPNPGI